MIETFYYSIAGKKPVQAIDDLIDDLISYEFTPREEVRVLKHVKVVAANGNYPSRSYFEQLYPYNGITYRSKAEIATYVASCKEFYHKQSLDQKVLSAVNESTTPKELIEQLNKITDYKVADDIDLDDCEPVLFGEDTHELVHGIDLGIKELDEVTMGGQPGTIGSVCAFTGHGKSTLVNSAAFKAALEGKKVAMLTLELPPTMMWKLLEARYLFQVKGIAVTGQDLIFNKVPSDVLEQIKEAEPDFRKDIVNNVFIFDESKISKKMMLDYKQLTNFMRAVAEKLGGIDLWCIDHVGQFELMWPDCGNNIIKSVQSFTKTFKDQRGIAPFTLLAVQANREGEKRARKRDGVYDMQAISDLNEVERSSTYIIFMYTSDDMKITQETKVTLAKHRLGAVITEPIVTTFNPAVITVGSAVETVSMSDDDFNSMDLDLGGGFDDDF